MTFHTYMLHCADGSYYLGHSDNLEQRIAQHQAGEIAGYTQSRRPVTLVWSQEFSSRDEALSAEQQIKGWSRKKKEGLIAGDSGMLSGKRHANPSIWGFDRLSPYSGRTVVK